MNNDNWIKKLDKQVDKVDQQVNYNKLSSSIKMTKVMKKKKNTRDQILLLLVLLPEVFTPT